MITTQNALETIKNNGYFEVKMKPYYDKDGKYVKNIDFWVLDGRSNK